MKTTENIGVKVWETTSTRGLLRHRNGIYYARLQVLGKRKLVSLKTNHLPTAKLRLGERQANAIKARRSQTRVEHGIATMGDLIAAYLGAMASRTEMSEHARKSKTQSIARIKANWPGIAQLSPHKVSIHDIAQFADRLGAKAQQKMPKGTKTKRTGYSPAITKRTLEVLKKVFKLGVEAGALSVNPFDRKDQLDAPLSKAPQAKRIELPPVAKMDELIAAIGTPPPDAMTDARVASGLRSGAQDCVELVRGLAYTGMRLGEARAFVWEDIDADTITVRGTKTENSRDRVVPIVPPMRTLIAEMRARRVEKNWPLAGKVFRVSECQKSINRACKQVGIKRLTHHDFRHYFATTCIESGVDIPTVSRWLGHADGGALAMKTYGHLRPEHSITQAAKVTFGKGGANA